jgi:hypothetical protein
MEKPPRRDHLKFFALNSSPIVWFIKQTVGNSSQVENPSQDDLVHLANNDTTIEDSLMQTFDQSRQVHRSISQKNVNPESLNPSPNPIKENGLLSESQSVLEWLSRLTSQMHQADTIDALLETTVIEVRQLLRVDRALTYRFQTEKQGVVLAESLAEGYTPSLGEALPAIAFGGEI